MATDDGRPARRKGPRRRTRPDGFFGRHFRPPSAFGIIVITLAAAVAAGFVTAVVWSANDTAEVRGAPEAPPQTPPPPDQDAPAQTTTTTRPDLSLESMDKKLRPLIWTVDTMDAAGQPATGAAFAAGMTEGRTLLLTSLALVQAATRAPGPGITVKNGTFNAPAALWTWDEGRDLALLVVEGKGNSPSLPWAGDNPPLRVGDPIFAVGVDRVVPGVVAGVSPGAIQHNIFIDDPLRGGALVNIKGEVLAVASPAFTPGAQITDTVFFGVPIRVVCAAVLNCETGDIDRNAATTTTGRTRRTTPSTARARGATSTTG